MLPQGRVDQAHIRQNLGRVCDALVIFG
jgi:hypothetical protein